MRAASSATRAARTMGPSLARPAAQACWDARRALQLARRGERLGGRQLIEHLRREFQGREFTELSIRLSLAEGILSLPVVAAAVAPWSARDRFARAWALSRHQADAALAALAGAWSAHGLLAAGHWRPFAEAAVTGLGRARAADHEALARWALSLGNACLLADDTARAQVWFERARRQACADHDGPALADTLCDLAWYQIQRLQLLRAEQPEALHCAGVGPAMDRALSSLQTARAYVRLQAKESVSARYLNIAYAQATLLNLQGCFDRELASWDEAMAAHQSWSAAQATVLPEESAFAQSLAVFRWCAQAAWTPADRHLAHPPDLETLGALAASASAVERLKLWDSVWRVTTRMPPPRRRRLGSGYHSGVAQHRQEALAVWREQQLELRTCLQGGDLEPHRWTSWYEP